MSYDENRNGLQRYAATPPDEKRRVQTVRMLGLPASASNNRVLQSLCETLAELLSVPMAGDADYSPNCLFYQSTLTEKTSNPDEPARPSSVTRLEGLSKALLGASKMYKMSAI